MLSKAEIKLEQEAVKHWQAMKTGQYWKGWMKIGLVLMRLREEAMHAAGTNKPEGRGYNTEFSRRCDEVFRHPAMDPVLRSHLLWLMSSEVRPLCEAIRTSWTIERREKVNNPTTMAKIVRRHIAERDGEAKPKPKTAAQERREHEARMAELQERLASVDGSPQEVAVAWFLDQPTDYVARVCVASDPAKAAVLRDSLAAAIAQHEAFESAEQDA